MTNPFDMFDAPAPAASAGGLPPGLPGPVPADESAAAVPSAAPAPAQAVNPFDQFDPPPPRTGAMANIGAGIQKGVAGLVNAVSDPFGTAGQLAETIGTAAYNRGASAFGYQPIPDDIMQVVNLPGPPEPGDRLVNALNRAGGVPTPDEITPANNFEKYLRAAAQGATGLAILGPAGLDTSLPRAAASVTKQGALGAVSGVGAQAASDAAPDDLKPVAGLLGGIVAPGLASLSAAIGQGAARPIVNGLMDYAAPAVGKPNALLDAAGAPILDARNQPVIATPSQARIAGQRIQGAATDPQAVQQILDNPPPAPLPGVQPTTFQVTRDPGLGSLELGVSQGAGAPAFRAQADAANDARIKLLEGIAANADPAAASTGLQRTAADIDAQQAAQVQGVKANAAALLARAQAEHDATIAGLQSNAGQALDAVGGNLPPGSEGAVGQALRAPVSDAMQASLAAKAKAWDAIDPDGTQTVDMQPIRAGARQLLSEMSPNAKPLTGDEADILNTAANLPPVQPFRDLWALRGRITDAISQERSNPQGSPPTVRRLGLLLGNVQTALDGAAADAAEPAASSAGAGAAAGGAAANPFSRFDAFSPAGGASDAVATQTSAAPSLGSSVFTPSGQKIDVRYRVREAGDLVPSQLEDGRNNPAFPSALQPRDRTRAASLNQVQGIASRLEPERLGASASTAEGAPIVGPDGIVESGNGRTLAIKQAYAQGGDRAAAYRAYLQDQGYDTTGMKAPVLVRERVTPLDDAARAKFADDAGASPVLGMSAAERAAADSGRLSNDTLQLLRGGDVGSAGNADFVRAFAREALPEGERAGFATSDGQLSVEGAARVRNALTQRAYGSNNLVSALAEHADENVRAFGGALADAAPSMAKLKGAIATGMVDKVNDLSPALVEAAGMVQQARRSGIALRDAVAQRDAFSQRNPLTDAMLRAAYGDDLSGRMSRAKVVDLLGHYADEAQAQGGLFGQNRQPADILREATERYGYGTQRAGAVGGGVAAATDGAGAGQNRGAAFGPVNGAAGQGNAGAGRGGGSVLPEAAPLTANFDRGTATRYAQARAATAAHAATFKDAPGVGQIMQGGKWAGDFRTPDSAVPNIIVKTGPAGADVAQAYLRAGGSPDALTEAAAFSLRQAAMKPDGTLNPAAYAKWVKERSAFLSQIPDAAQRFGSAASASQALQDGVRPAAQTLQQAAAIAERTVNDAAANRAAAIKEYQDSVAGKFLGNADPVAQVGSVLRSKTAVADMDHLAKLTANDPDARAGLQRAVVEHVLRDIRSNARGAASQESYLASDAFHTLMRTREAALAKILTPEQLNSFKAVADSLEQSNLSVSGNKVGGGSPSAQNLSAMIASKHTNLLQRMTHEMFGAALGSTPGYVIGSALAGAPGGYLGGFLGGGVGKAIQSAREAGLKNADDLVTQAMLNPALARVLLTKVTPANQVAILGALRAQLGRLSLVSSARGSQAAPGGNNGGNDRRFIGVQTGQTVQNPFAFQNPLASYVGTLNSGLSRNALLSASHGS